MTKLSREDILKLAQLCRLQLSEAEVERLRSELTEILEYVEQLDKVDTKGLVPTSQVTGLKNVMRSDEEWDYGYSAKELLKNAPAIEAKQFKVKRVIN